MTTSSIESADADLCPLCKGPEHPEFMCLRCVWEVTERGQFLIHNFPTHEAARLYCEERRAKEAGAKEKGEV
jgi:hypothetical protein